MERTKQLILDLSEKNLQELEEEFARCQEQAALALRRYEFLYAEEMNERMKLILKYIIQLL
ncbi:hypothetical protein J7E73_29240 [Paenibacillus albidus]|uniref:hypothetical protein n=1 Tax=Paenibacillus albidus TaxID=2041023 RepID=UPI001BEA9AD2|nr:hypothetical protein [Paenibacillus albidus]MBT2293127.1 hypothetical protein [Paenibacillus albidus]